MQHKFPVNSDGENSYNVCDILTIKIDRAIATIDRQTHTFGSPRLDNGIHKFPISQSTPSQYSDLIIQPDGNIYLISNNTRVMQLTTNGDMCGWAPAEYSRNSRAIARNNSPAKAPEIPRELPIAEEILKILTQFPYELRINEHNTIILSHNNSPILSITADKKPKLYLIPENNLELIFQQSHDNCYIFINNQTNIEISICTSGQIIFQQIRTNIRETFTHQNISELLNMQLFYFKFTEIYALLHHRFFQNGDWNKTLKINKRDYPKCCFFEFQDNRPSIELKLKITYDHIQKEYKYFIVQSRYNEDIWELWKDRHNQNEYITNEHLNYEYKINLATKQIFKINTSQNVNSKGTFEFKWSSEKLYHWENFYKKSQLQKSQLSVEEEEIGWNEPGPAAANFSSFVLKAKNASSLNHIQLNNNGNQKSIYDRIKKILQSNYTINSSKLIKQINLNFENTQVLSLSLTSELVLTILCHQFIEFTYYNFERSFYKFKNTETNKEIWINNNGNIVYIENSSNQSTYNNSNIINILNICPLPLIPNNQNSTTIAPLNLVSKLQQSNEPIRAKNIKIDPDNISKLLQRFTLFKGINPKSPFDKLFKMNNKGMPVLYIEFHGVPYRLTWNNSTKLIKINSSNKKSSEIENVTNKLKFLEKCGFEENVKIFTDFSLTFDEHNNTIIYNDDDTKQQITLTSKDNNTFLSEKCTINNIQGYLWYDTDDCEKIYFIVNNSEVYCYKQGNWEKITEYPQKLKDFIKKDSRPNVNQNSKKKFAELLVELLKKSKKNNNNTLQLVPINPNLLQSVKDLLSNLPKLSNKLNQPPLNITAQISPNLFLIPYGETSIVVAKHSDRLFPFPLLYREGVFYCKLGNLTLKIKYDGSNYVFELKNEDGSNVSIYPKLIGYNQEKAVEINNITNSSNIPQSEPKIILTNTLQKLPQLKNTKSRSILPSLKNQLRTMQSQIPPVNPQASLQNTELIAKINENIMIIRRLNRYYVIFEHNGQQYEYELTKDNNILYCINCSIQIQGKDQLFNFSYDVETKEHKFKPIVQKRISNNRVKYLSWEDCWKDNKIQITDNMYIEHDPQNDRYFLRGQILSPSGASSTNLNEPMQKNGNILSTFLNGKMINYDINRCKELDYNPFIKKNNKNNKNNQVNNELGTFLDLLKRENDILDLINKNNTNINLLTGFINKFHESYKKLNEKNKIKYEKQYTTFKSRIIEKIDIVIEKNQIKQQASNDSSLPIWTHQKSPIKTKLNKLKNILSELKDNLLEKFRSPTRYSQLL